MPYRITAFVFIACGVLPLSAAVGDTVDLVDLHLSNGSRAQGPLKNETANSYVVHQTVFSKNGEMSSDRVFAKSDVMNFVHVQVEYDQRSSTMGDDAEAHAALAKWCLDEQFFDAADRHAHRSLSKDAVNAQAIEVLVALGYVDDNGTWLKAGDYLTAHGLVSYDDKIMTLAQRDSLIELARQRQTDLSASENLQRQVDAITTLIAQDKERLDTEGRERTDLDKRIASNHREIGAVDSAKKALDTADARVRSEEKRIIRRAHGSSTGYASNASLDAQRSAKQAYSAALATALNAQADMHAATTQQAAAIADQQNTQIALVAQRSKLVVITTDAATAKVKAQLSDNGYAEAMAAILPPSDLPIQFSGK